jgi:hypothetical protein
MLHTPGLAKRIADAAWTPSATYRSLAPQQHEPDGALER